MVKRELAQSIPVERARAKSLTLRGVAMLTLFLRAVFMYGFVFLILRLTGKRQVADLQPFDLLITLLVADLAGSALGDPGVPLLYSVVPILALYITQQFVTWLCLKSAGARRVVCGTPVVLISDGHMEEEHMRSTNYTVIDVMDQLRAKDVFDISEVAYAILETNGTMSVLLKEDLQAPTRADLGLKADKAGLSVMLALDGQSCRDELKKLGRDEQWLAARARELGAKDIKEVFYLQQGADGELRMQKKEKRRHV